MKLRPHHLLCTQGYSGKGYSQAFVANMTLITNQLRAAENIPIEIVFSTDDICEKCPRKLGDDQCIDNRKVKSFDRKVVDYFDLKEGVYYYDTLLKEIRSKMNEAMMADICQGCSWYPVSACRVKMVNQSC